MLFFFCELNLFDIDIYFILKQTFFGNINIFKNNKLKC